MRDFLSKYKKPTALAVGATVLILYFALRPGPSVRGARDARLDLAHGYRVNYGSTISAMGSAGKMVLHEKTGSHDWLQPASVARQN